MHPRSLFSLAEHLERLSKDGDPLEVTTFADRVFIRGEEIPMESRQTLLRDRYR